VTFAEKETTRDKREGRTEFHLLRKGKVNAMGEASKSGEPGGPDLKMRGNGGLREPNEFCEESRGKELQQGVNL